MGWKKGNNNFLSHTHTPNVTSIQLELANCSYNCSLNSYNGYSEANLGFFQAQSDMRVGQ